MFIPINLKMFSIVARIIREHNPQSLDEVINLYDERQDLQELNAVELIEGVDLYNEHINFKPSNNLYNDVSEILKPNKLCNFFDLVKAIQGHLHGVTSDNSELEIEVQSICESISDTYALDFAEALPVLAELRDDIGHIDLTKIMNVDKHSFRRYSNEVVNTGYKPLDLINSHILECDDFVNIHEDPHPVYPEVGLILGPLGETYASDFMIHYTEHQDIKEELGDELFLNCLAVAGIINTLTLTIGQTKEYLTEEEIVRRVYNIYTDPYLIEEIKNLNPGSYGPDTSYFINALQKELAGESDTTYYQIDTVFYPALRANIKNENLRDILLLVEGKSLSLEAIFQASVPKRQKGRYDLHALWLEAYKNIEDDEIALVEEFIVTRIRDSEYDTELGELVRLMYLDLTENHIINPHEDIETLLDL